ncbi:6-pyruvoyl-tetrahydropterin synthase [Amycolatopsis vancoresmycina DSM 44592]|uniref:6-pyruvoyl-tetrahydropterin synthase n=1 Tax=Amycolatopsis vancoresmycina DSM 44592 TaxID=1292037 RepID=R1GH14_9PSEU|nr:6-pyruvoyl-tetrahydropterin synthase [Amycolatopsis vancoresmycina DSM 44592]
MGQDLAEEVLRALALRRGEELFRRRVLDDLAVGHEDHPIGCPPGEPHLVGDDEHRHAVLGEARHHVEDLLDHLRVQRRGRLVEQHDLGPHRQRPRDGDALLLATRKLRRVLVGLVGDADALQQLHRRLARFGLRGLADLHRREHDVLDDGLVREQVERLEHHADVGPQRGQCLALGGQRDAVDGDLARVDRLQPVDRPAQGRLAGARRPEHHDDLAARHLQRDLPEHVQVAEVLVHGGRLDHRRRHLRGHLASRVVRANRAWVTTRWREPTVALPAGKAA